MTSWEDDWTTEELSERCICGHILGQHEFGSIESPCDERVRECDCYRFIPQNDYTDAYTIAWESARRSRLRQVVQALSPLAGGDSAPFATPDTTR